MGNIIPSIYKKNIPSSSSFDSRPDFKRAIVLDVVDINSGTATNIYQILGDGWLAWQGLVDSDQDVIIVAAPCAEAIYTNLSPSNYDRIIIGADHGNGADKGSGMIYISGDHTWFIYGQGNDKQNWRMSFIPSKGNTMAASDMVKVIPHGAVTTFYSYPAHGKLTNSIRIFSGYQIDFKNIGTITQNHPLDYTKFPDHASLQNAVTMNGISSSNLPNPRPIIHQPSIPTESIKRYTLTGYTTLTDTGSDNKTRRINRYWYCYGNSYTTTYKKYNEWRVYNSDKKGNLESAPILGNNLILIENVVTPSTGPVESSKWRAVYQFNWLERAYADDSGSYARLHNRFLGSKISVMMKRPVQLGDEGKWIRYNDTQMWKIIRVYNGTTAGKLSFDYIPYTFGNGSQTGYTITEGTQTAKANDSSERLIYNYDEIDNPHPYNYTFPNYWTFQSSDITCQDGKNFRIYVWGFKHHWCAISPIVSWNAGTDITRNTENIVGPSEFVEKLNFSGNWTVLHSSIHNSNAHIGHYLDDNRFTMCKTGDAVGFRILKDASNVDSRFIQGEEISTVNVDFRMNLDGKNSSKTQGWGSHPLSATVTPEGSSGDENIVATDTTDNTSEP